LRTTEANGEARERVSPDVLYALAEGMHTMAQPLTVLRATLEIAAGNACCVSQFQRAVDTSLAEVSRLSEAMRFVQELMRIARDESAGSPAEVSNVLGIVVEDLRCVLDSAGVSLKIEIAEDLPPGQVSAIRLRQCLFYLLQHAAKSCQPKESVLIQAKSEDETLRLTIQAESKADVEDQPHHELPWGGTMPCLVLAETLLNADGGRVNWESKPFAAHVTLRKASKEASVRIALSNSNAALIESPAAKAASEKWQVHGRPEGRPLQSVRRIAVPFGNETPPRGESKAE
jgi:hypothetical protein